MVLTILLATFYAIMVAYTAIRIKKSGSLTSNTGLLMVSFVVLPFVTWFSGFLVHYENAKKTEFCLSCHEMTPYGKSLFIDDNEYVPANHFQSARVDQNEACYTCHTSYTMFGGVEAKMKGMKHLLVHFTKDTKQGEIKLYEEFNNRECLHCHENSRPFLLKSEHNDENANIADLLAGKQSCISSGCHDVAHDVANFEDVEFFNDWRVKK